MTPLALSTFGDAVQTIAVIVAALLAALTLVHPAPKVRALSMLGALILTPVLLIGHIWNTSQFETFRDHPAVAVVAGAVALAALYPAARIAYSKPEWLALAAAAAIPFRIPIDTGGGSSNLLVPLYLVIATGALAYAVPRLRGMVKDAEVRKPALFEWLLAGALVLYAVQAAYSDDFDRALQQIIFFYVPFALLYSVLVRIEWDKELALRCLFVVLALAVAFVFVGFWEYDRRELLLNPKVVSSNQFEDYFRVNSLFFDPNIYGRFLTVVMLGLTAALLWAKEQRTVLLTTAGLALLMAGLVLTLSQSSFTGLICGLAVLGALKFGTRYAVWAGGAIAVAGAIVIIAAPGSVGLDQSSDAATSGRSELMEGGLRLFTDKPVQGYGAGAFRRAYRREENASDKRAVNASHNIPITIAAEQGIAGLLLYIALVLAAGAALLRGARDSPARAAVAAAFIAIVAHTQLYAAFLEDPLVWALLAVGAALPVPIRHRLKRDPAPV